MKKISKNSLLLKEVFEIIKEKLKELKEELEKLNKRIDLNEKEFYDRRRLEGYLDKLYIKHRIKKKEKKRIIRSIYRYIKKQRINRKKRKKQEILHEELIHLLYKLNSVFYSCIMNDIIILESKTQEISSLIEGIFINTQRKNLFFFKI